ncbi:hypothetical protein EAH85_10500 [Curtobacterium flaccumfaciens]|nr:hypothetical protein EAH85_10500 [Curtobacterium flaccumfaciens]
MPTANLKRKIMLENSSPVHTIVLIVVIVAIISLIVWAIARIVKALRKRQAIRRAASFDNKSEL